MFTSLISSADQTSYRDAARTLVRKARLSLGITQARLGQAVGLSQGEISRIETGSVDPPAWLIMYFIHLYPDLRGATRADIKQLRKAAHQGIDKMNESTLRVVMALMEKSQRANPAISGRMK